MGLNRVSMQSAAPPATAPAVLRGQRLLVARAAWLIAAALIVTLFITGIPVYFEHLRTVCARALCEAAPTPPPGIAALRDLGLSPTTYAAYYTALDVVVALVYLAVAAFVLRRRPEERIALLSAFTLLIWGLVTVPFTISAVTEVYPAWRPAFEYAQFVSLASFTLFFYLFPDGRFSPRWARWLAATLLALLLPGYLLPDSAADYREWPPPIAGLVVLTWMGSVIGLQIYRYRRVSDPIQRQQTKWVVSGLAGALLGFFLFVPLPEIISPATGTGGDALRNLLSNTGMFGSMLLIPISIGVAILRHRLWDIDIVISRALVYGTLTGTIVTLYALIVGGLGALLRVEDNPVLSLLAAGVIAVVFAPLRDRLQRTANRLLYGERNEPYRVISRLGERLEAVLEPAAVLPMLVETVAQALKLPYAAIAIQQGTDRELAASCGVPQADLLRLPLTYRGEGIGELALAPRSPGDPFTAADRRLLADLARQAGVAAHAVLLTADLERSRQRIVTAREEARRRLGSDLHDGLGHRLAALLRKAEIASNLLDRDPTGSRAALADLTRQAHTAIAEVRGLAHALHPPELELLGLAGALRERARQYSGPGEREVQVSVEAPETLPPLPVAVEAAAYYIAQEALTNVHRHAAARCCHLRLALVVSTAHEGPVLTAADTSILELEITDDGRGPSQGEPTTRVGLGIASMRDRAAEIGGSCVVERGAAGGTRVYARLPCTRL